MSILLPRYVCMWWCKSILIEQLKICVRFASEPLDLLVCFHNILYFIDLQPRGRSHIHPVSPETELHLTAESVVYSETQVRASHAFTQSSPPPQTHLNVISLVSQ